MVSAVKLIGTTSVSHFLRVFPASLRVSRQRPFCVRERGCLPPPVSGTCGILPARLSGIDPTPFVAIMGREEGVAMKNWLIPAVVLIAVGGVGLGVGWSINEWQGDDEVALVPTATAQTG